MKLRRRLTKKTYIIFYGNTLYRGRSLGRTKGLLRLKVIISRDSIEETLTNIEKNIVKPK
jgi:hypothetical protein